MSKTKEQREHDAQIDKLRKLHTRLCIPIGIRIECDNSGDQQITSVKLMTDKYGTIMPTSVFYNSSQKLLKMED